MNSLIKLITGLTSKVGPLAVAIITLVGTAIGAYLFVKAIIAMKKGKNGFKEVIELVGAVILIGLMIGVGYVAFLNLGGKLKPDSDLLPTGSINYLVDVAQENYGKLLG